MNWKQKAADLRFDKGLSWTEINKAVGHLMVDVPIEKRQKKIRDALRYDPRYKPSHTPPIPGRTEEETVNRVMSLLKKGTTFEEIEKETQLSLDGIVSFIKSLKSKGYNILYNNEEVQLSSICLPTNNIVPHHWDGSKTIKFGLLGDTHINSKYTQLTHLHALYDIYAQEGITDVYHTGDIDEGEEMRLGHKYECYTQGADCHVEEIVRVYPKRKNMITHLIIGNHDASLIKRAGMDIGIAIARERADMNYLGAMNAMVYLTDNCELELRHPGGGTAYAISYKTQKMIEAMGADEKPKIFAFGHFHKSEYLLYRNVHAIQTGTLQSQTPFMREHASSATMGGWIIEIEVDAHGTIERFRCEFIPFYAAIPNDYKNWR